MVHQVEERLSYIQQKVGNVALAILNRLKSHLALLSRPLQTIRARADRIAESSLPVRSQADCRCRSCFNLRRRCRDDLVGYTGDIVGLEMMP